MNRSVQVLVESLRNDDPRLRQEATVQLMWLGERAKGAVDALLELLEDPVRDVRLWAACAVARLDPGKAKGCIPLLIEGLQADGEL